MRSTIISATAVVLAGLNLVNAQTFTDCDPTKKTCPPNPGLGGTLTTDFTKKSSDWTEADGTTLTYGPNGAEFNIKTKTGAPTIGVNKYIQFGKVSVTMKASPGTGVISSFILESQDLDEIDFEWVGGDTSHVQSNFFGKGNTTTYDRGATHAVANPMTEFVTYAIDWTKDSFKFYVAGNMVREVLYNDPKTNGGHNYPQTPMRVKMGSWVGCPDAAAAASDKLKYTCEWAGGPLPENPNFTMYVKSVSIEDYGCGGEYTYTDLTGSYQSIKSSGTCDGKVDETTPTSSKAASASASASTKPGGVLIETSSGVSSKTSTASGTAAAATTSGSASTTGSASNTLATTATPATGSAASATTSAASTVTANAASSMKPKHKYGVLDMGVMALGLGLGYLVM